MTEFTDTQGRIWGIKITLGTAKQVLDKTGIDLLNPTDLANFDNDGELNVEKSGFVRFIMDDMFICNVVSACISKQAQERGMTQDDIDEIFDAQTIKKAQKAFIDEYSIFFTERGNYPAQALITTIKEGIENLANEELVGKTLSDLQEGQKL